MNYSDWGQSGDPNEWAGKHTYGVHRYIASEPQWFDVHVHVPIGKSFGLVSADQSSMFILRTNRHKLVYFRSGLPPLLYDLKKDPGEAENLGEKSCPNLRLVKPCSRVY